MANFNKVFENFTGSGNINGKYWIVGLEEGGKLKPDEKENQYLKIINEGNEIKIAEHLSKFNGEAIENTGFLRLLNSTLISIDEYNNCTKDKKYDFSETGNVFRTNIYPLKHKTSNDSLDSIYKETFNFDDGMTKMLYIIKN